MNAERALDCELGKEVAVVFGTCSIEIALSYVRGGWWLVMPWERSNVSTSIYSSSSSRPYESLESHVSETTLDKDAR